MKLVLGSQQKIVRRNAFLNVISLKRFLLSSILMLVERYGERKWNMKQNALRTHSAQRSLFSVRLLLSSTVQVDETISPPPP